MYLLDTNIMIYAQKNRNTTVLRYLKLKDIQDFISIYGTREIMMRLVVSRLFLLVFFLAACHNAVRPSATNESGQSVAPIGAGPSAVAVIDNAIPPLAILVFENQTSEPILEHKVISVLKESFLRNDFSIVRKREEAAFILTGKINQFTKTPIALNAQGRAEAYRITIGIQYLLSPQKGSPFTWNDTADSDFAISANIADDQAAQDRAIREISWNLSESATDTLLIFFKKQG